MHGWGSGPALSANALVRRTCRCAAGALWRRRGAAAAAGHAPAVERKRAGADGGRWRVTRCIGMARGAEIHVVGSGPVHLYGMARRGMAWHGTWHTVTTWSEPGWLLLGPYLSLLAHKNSLFAPPCLTVPFTGRTRPAAKPRLGGCNHRHRPSHRYDRTASHLLAVCCIAICPPYACGAPAWAIPT